MLGNQSRVTPSLDEVGDLVVWTGVEPSKVAALRPLNPANTAFSSKFYSDIKMMLLLGPC
jgi:hypothetical protein